MDFHRRLQQVVFCVPMFWDVSCTSLSDCISCAARSSPVRRQLHLQREGHEGDHEGQEKLGDAAPAGDHQHPDEHQLPNLQRTPIVVSAAVSTAHSISVLQASAEVERHAAPRTMS